MQNPYYPKGLSQSLYNSSYLPSRSYDDYVKPPVYRGDRSYAGESRYASDDYYNYAQTAAKPQGKVWSDYIPIEKRYLDYVPQQKVEYMPVERNYTDYLEVEHQVDYVPVPKLNRHIEYIPIEKYDQSVDYYPYEKSYVKGMGGEAPRVQAPVQPQTYPNGGYGYSGQYYGTQNYGGERIGAAYGPPPTNYQTGYGAAGSGYGTAGYGGYGRNYGYVGQPQPQPRAPYPNYGRDGYWQNKYY